MAGLSIVQAVVELGALGLLGYLIIRGLPAATKEISTSQADMLKTFAENARELRMLFATESKEQRESFAHAMKENREAAVQHGVEVARSLDLQMTALRGAIERLNEALTDVCRYQSRRAPPS